MYFASILDLTWARIRVAIPCGLSLSLALRATVCRAGDGPRAVLKSAVARLVALFPRVLTPGAVDLCCVGEI